MAVPYGIVTSEKLFKILSAHTLSKEQPSTSTPQNRRARTSAQRPLSTTTYSANGDGADELPPSLARKEYNKEPEKGACLISRLSRRHHAKIAVKVLSDLLTSTRAPSSKPKAPLSSSMGCRALGKSSDRPSATPGHSEVQSDKPRREAPREKPREEGPSSEKPRGLIDVQERTRYRL